MVAVAIFAAMLGGLIAWARSRQPRGTISAMIHVASPRSILGRGDRSESESLAGLGQGPARPHQESERARYRRPGVAVEKNCGWKAMRIRSCRGCIDRSASSSSENHSSSSRFPGAPRGEQAEIVNAVTNAYLAALPQYETSTRMPGIVRLEKVLQTYRVGLAEARRDVRDSQARGGRPRGAGYAPRRGRRPRGDGPPTRRDPGGTPAGAGLAADDRPHLEGSVLHRRRD